MKKIYLYLLILLIPFVCGFSPTITGSGKYSSGVTTHLSETWDSCTAASEPDANCDETWDASEGVDVWMVQANAGSTGSDNGLTHLGADTDLKIEGLGLGTGPFTVTIEFVCTTEASAESLVFFARDTDDDLVYTVYMQGNGDNTFDARYRNYAGTYTDFVTGLSESTWYKLVINDFDFTNDTADYAVYLLNDTQVGSTCNDCQMRSSSADNFDDFVFSSTVGTIDYDIDDTTITAE